MLTRSEPAEARSARAGRAGARVRLLHRLLSTGGDDVGRFRGWARLMLWHDSTPEEKRRAVRQTLLLPARAARDAYRDVRRFGPDVARHAGVPRRRQVMQLWWLKVRHGIDAMAYLDYQLYRPERWERAAQFIQEWEFFKVSRFINRTHLPESDVGLLVDKSRFDEWCRQHDLPATRTLLEFHDGEIVASALPGGTLPACDLFSKPADSTGGHGTARWLHDGAGGYVGVDGRRRNPTDLLAELATISRTLPRKSGKLSRRILLQKALTNHRALAPLAPGALCTVRMLTYRWPDRQPELLFGVYKMAVGAAPADNFHYGGILAPVDLGTGRLGPAVHRQGRLIVSLEHHPDTGAPIAGQQLPVWDEARQLVLRAHAAVRRVPSIGWDVALTDDGPVLVEGNSSSNPDIAQAPSGIPLGDTPFVQCVNVYARECFEG